MAREARQDRRGRRRPPTSTRRDGDLSSAGARSRPTRPSSGRLPGGAHRLVKPARVPVDDQGVAVAVRGGAALDLHAGGDRIRPAVGLVRVLERGPCSWLASCRRP